MTNPILVRVPPSDAYRRHIQRSGFDLDDPDCRHPVQSWWRELKLDPSAPAHSSRQDLLIQARQGAGRVISRSLCLMSAAIGSLTAAAPAEARRNQALDYPITPKTPARLEPDPLFEMVKAVSLPIDGATPNSSFTVLPTLDDPIWTVGLLALLAITSMTNLGIRLVQSIQSKSRNAQMPAKISLPFDMHEVEAFGQTTDNDTRKDVATGVEHQSSQKKLKWHTDGASRTGKVRDENQDRFNVLKISPNRAILILCDGAGGVAGGRQAAICAEEAITKTLLNLSDENNTTLSEVDLEMAITAAQAQAKQLDLPGVSTAIVVALQDDRVTYATLGDGNLALIWPDGMVSQILAPHHQAGQPSNVINAYIGRGNEAPPRTGAVRVESGTTVMAMSDGAGDLFPFNAYGLTHRDQTDAWREIGDGFADLLAAEIEAGRDEDTGAYLHSDNMTIAMAHLERMEVRNV